MKNCKKYIYRVISLSLVLSFFSCKKDFLDMEPQSQASAVNFYKTPADMEQAVMACYDALQSTGQYGQNFVYFMEVRGDNSTLESITANGGIYGDFDQFRISPANSILNETWSALYNGIQRCNIVLNRIDNVKMDAGTKNQLIGEAKFIRALSYFNAVRIWGDVPLVQVELQDPFDAYAHERSGSDRVYAAIIKDLEDAGAVLPVVYSSALKGRATSGSAKAMLGKVYLTLGYYSMAAQTLVGIINSGVYSLSNTYSDNFNPATENGVESIFEVQFQKGANGEGSVFANRFSPTGSTIITGGVGNTYGENIPTHNLVSMFDSTDLRFSVTVDSLNSGRYFTRKYVDVPFEDGDADNNFIVIRYADVLLMAAEALNEISFQPADKAFEYLNLVRKRAHIDNVDNSTVANQEDFREFIAGERVRELSFENHRWFDLVRTGKATEVINQNLGFTISQNQWIYPIPQQQIDISAGKLTQNIGY